MTQPKTSCSTSLHMTCLAVTMTVVIATCMVSAFPRERRQYFTTCWGWGASCSMHSPVGRAPAPAVRISRPTQRRGPVYPFNSRGGRRGGIPSIVTSGGWEPGTMGKRRDNQQLETEDILKFLQRRSQSHAPSQQ